MFLHKQIKKGNAYYSLVETYRDGGKMKHRTRSLGREPKLWGIHSRKSQIFGSGEDFIYFKDKSEILPEDIEKFYAKYPELHDLYLEYRMKKYPDEFCSHRTRIYKEIQMKTPKPWVHKVFLEDKRDCFEEPVISYLDPENIYGLK